MEVLLECSKNKEYMTNTRLNKFIWCKHTAGTATHIKKLNITIPIFSIILPKVTINTRDLFSLFLKLM